nr:K(+) efflux antiporter 2, chloroplastic-like [Tanacetum cinerariifolium]
MFEDKAQRISEAAIASKDVALKAWDNVNLALIAIEEIVKEEDPTKEAIQRAKMALSLAEARHQVALDSLEVAKERNGDL